MAGRNRSSADWALIPLRLVVGVVFLMHGGQKLFGGLDGFAGSLAELGFEPARVWAIVAALSEFLGGAAVLVGLLTRLGALGIACVMGVAVFKVHLANGFFLSARGFEYPFVLLGCAISLIVAGGGTFSLDALMKRRK